METTFAEIIEMRNKLNQALCDKVGYQIDVGFDVEMSSFQDDLIAFKCAYTKEIETPYSVSGLYKKTPLAAFQSAMKAIDAHVELTKQDQINKLKEQIAELEGS